MILSIFTESHTTVQLVVLLQIIPRNTMQVIEFPETHPSGRSGRSKTKSLFFDKIN